MAYFRSGERVKIEGRSEGFRIVRPFNSKECRGCDNNSEGEDISVCYDCDVKRTHWVVVEERDYKGRIEEYFHGGFFETGKIRSKEATPLGRILVKQ